MKLAMMGLAPKYASTEGNAAKREVAPRRAFSDTVKSAEFRLFHAWRA